MELQMKFSKKELEDIYEALKIASIHTQAPAESDRMHLLSKKMEAVISLDEAVSK